MAATATETAAEKPVMVVALDDSEHSAYALEWTLDRFFAPFAPNPPFKLLLVHAKPSPSLAVGFGGPGAVGAVDVLPMVESELKRSAAAVIEKAKTICSSKSLNDVEVEVAEGDARNVICDAADRHHASILVVGSHGYGAIKKDGFGQR